MRFLALVLLGIVLASSARAEGAKPGHAFGSARCPQRLTCPSDGTTSTSDLLAAGNSCVTQYFGYPTPSDGFFENTSLDGKNCLTAKPNVLPKGVGAQLTPQCCVIEVGGSNCAFQCTLITQ